MSCPRKKEKRNDPLDIKVDMQLLHKKAVELIELLNQCNGNFKFCTPKGSLYFTNQSEEKLQKEMQTELEQQVREILGVTERTVRHRGDEIAPAIQSEPEEPRKKIDIRPSAFIAKYGNQAFDDFMKRHKLVYDRARNQFIQKT